jgi:hypothetical protein
VRRVATLTLVCSLAGFAAADVSASPDVSELIRPGVGIGKVRLGMTQAQVRRALGQRHAIVNVRERRFGLVYLELAYDYSAYTVGFFGAPGKLRVVSVATSLRSERTRNGLGPGTSLRALRRVLRGERCRRRTVVTFVGFQTECSVLAASGARTTFIAVPECDQRHICSTAQTVFEVVVSRAR